MARGAPISRCRQRGLALCLAFGVPPSVPASSSRHPHPGTFPRVLIGSGSRSLIRIASGLNAYIKFVEHQRAEA
jgi:hypothetical protein